MRAQLTELAVDARTPPSAARAAWDTLEDVPRYTVGIQEAGRLG
jgi:hypothetical protein